MKLRLLRINSVQLWIALVVGLLISGVAFAPTKTSAISGESITKDELGTVKLLILDPNSQIFGICSGSYLGGGIILTNFHCVGHTDLYGADDSGFNLKNGDFYNPNRTLAVAPQTDPRQVPKPTYYAHVVASNPNIDVAVLQIYSMIDPQATLPDSIPIPSITLTDSDKVKVGDEVNIFGYPGAGGDRITYTRGQISGFTDQTGNGKDDSFTTDAAINSGNSGGLSADVNGDQIGISTFAAQSQNGPGLGGIREVNLAVPYVNQAMKIGGSTPQPLASQTVVAGTPGPPQPTTTPGAGTPSIPGFPGFPGTPQSTTTPGAGTPSIPGFPGTPQPAPNGNGPFGQITFGSDVQNNQLVNQGTQFASGTTKIIGIFDYQGMRNGLKWGAVWKLNGEIGLDQRNDYTWDSGPSGTTGVSISLAAGLPDGSYDLLLYVNNQVVQQGSFTIGSPASTPTAEVPSTPRPNQSGVTLKGQIVDADTGNGIPGAAILILKPGVDINTLTNENLAQNTAAAGQADQDGFYLTAPAIPRGQSYTVIVAATNYQAQIFQDGLSIATNDPDVVEMQPIQLSAR